jgi:hypothetical protein
MGVIHLYGYKDRRKTMRLDVEPYEVFYYPEIKLDRKELFVHRITEDGLMVSRHLQTGGLFFTTNKFAVVLVIGRANPLLEKTITQLAREVSHG